MKQSMKYSTIWTDCHLKTGCCPNPLAFHLYKTNWKALEWIGALYVCVIIAELCFSERRLFFRQGA